NGLKGKYTLDSNATNPTKEEIVSGGACTPTGVEEQEIVIEYELLQNYPNPFNPSTTIEYSIPTVGNKNIRSVQIKVYNILGKEVTTLVNKEQPTGNYEVTFDASNLTSGVYYYRITSGSFTETKQMLLVK
ncbi:MAG: T9SS type A sorting domain-containing protein, partial [Melioribacteraceae bacterium]